MRLAVKDLCMRFGGVIALNDVAFDVQALSITALIGPNGAGKTTVFNCITGFYRAQHGTMQFFPPSRPMVDLVQVLGESFYWSDILQPQKWPRKLGYKMFGGAYRVARAGVARTFQNVRLFKDMSVMENLLVAQHGDLNRRMLSGLFNGRRFRHEEAQAIARAMDWLEFFSLTPDADRLAGQLPYGSQRRVEMARALCTQPALICLDEPAAGLNPQETEALRGLIQRLRTEHDITVLLIEHDMGLVMNISDHVVVLDHGEVIARGSPEEVQKHPKVLEAYLG